MSASSNQDQTLRMPTQVKLHKESTNAYMTAHSSEKSRKNPDAEEEYMPINIAYPLYGSEHPTTVQ